MNHPEQQLRMLLTNGWWQHLDAFSDIALASAPDSSLAIASKGFASLRRGKTDEALALFHDSLAIDATDVAARTGLFNLHYQDANFPKADEIIMGLLRDLPHEPALHAARCRLYAIFDTRKRTDEALREGLQLHPQDRELRTVELYHAYHGSDEQKKIAMSVKLLQLDPENLIAHVILGSTCLKERDFDNAQHHLKTCMAIAPSEDTARMLEVLEASRSGKGSWRLAVWAYRQKLLKRLFPKYYRRKRVKIRWDH